MIASLVRPLGSRLVNRLFWAVFLMSVALFGCADAGGRAALPGGDGTTTTGEGDNTEEPSGSSVSTDDDATDASDATDTGDASDDASDDATDGTDASDDNQDEEDDCGGCADNQVCNDGVCDCFEGFTDCDLVATNGCETLGECECEYGEERACYFGPLGTENVGTCRSGIEICNGIGWGFCEGSILPEQEPCTQDGLDQDCDGLTDEPEDEDGDGWFRCDGDCCDSIFQQCAENPALVNPGAYEFVGNEIDDDCDGEIDNVGSTDCSGGSVTSGVTADNMVMAMDLCQYTEGDPDKWGVVSTGLTNSNGIGTPQDIQVGVLNGLGAGLVAPLANSTVAVISSGDARGVGDPGYTSSNSDGSSNADSGPSDYLAVHGNQLQTSASCPATDASVYDTVRLSMTVRVPTNAQGFQYDFRFWTYEYPQYICTQYNDFFLALLDSGHPDIPADKNISFDAAGNPVSVNNAFFTTCDALSCYDSDHYFMQTLLAPDSNSDGCVDALSCNSATNLCETSLGACPDGSSDVLAFTNNVEAAGATGWLTTSAPVVPGEEITLNFHIWDTGDSAYDSLVIIDNFQWLIEPTELSTKN
ncbi:MAG: hypothetical protein HOI23_14790 [Deltaproteobacteria bacterium]|nr:hypothetical protein [Deltaproteobacteria bacterium]MBT6435065.1 hypothetical protein [Deltaproteobacteria bacterium]MBT6492160.1 hypothetical protein [Deltaproteobacteria bacterium]